MGKVYRRKKKTVMKRVTTFLSAMCFFTMGANAQSAFWNGEKDENPINFEVMAGLNVSKFTHVDMWDKAKVGVNVGVMAEKPILKSLSAKAGVFYTMKGAVGKRDIGNLGPWGSIGTLKTTFSPAYLEIPILASYRYGINETMRVQFDFGPYFAGGLHGKDVKEVLGDGLSSKTETEYKLFSGDDKQLKRFDFGFRFGPEFVLKDKFSVGIAYEISAVNISKMGGKIGNGNFMINLGYRFFSMK